MLFDEPTLRKLNTLTLIANKVRAGAMKGDRRSKKRGVSIEFADYRDYVPGDDLRHLDWNVYARLERPFIKLFEEEEDLAVHLLVDASKSMNWGGISGEINGDHNKFDYARKLTAALGTIALSAGDQITIGFLTPTGTGPQYGPARGVHHTLRLLTYLEKQPAAGQTNLNQSLQTYALAARRPGLTFIITDLFDPNGYESGLGRLQSRGHELVLLHLLSPDELDPQLAGDLRFVDIETGYTQEVSLDSSIRDLYRARVAAWQDEIRLFCQKREIHYLPLSTAVPWDKVVLFQMRREGIVK
ncbi:MAG TPA: DUF58 domain-containing protein [Anaerolineales bacterium]|nr:DUF58 domain-containing protein [Anaerolineales bacterium]